MHPAPRGTVIASKPKWTSTRYAYAGLAANGGCLLVLLANLISGNAFWQVAVGIAVGCLLLGAVFGFQARRLRIHERRGNF